MNISTHIIRLAKTIALGSALLALVVPAASAKTILPANFRGDDHFRDASVSAPLTVLPANFRGDDHFRDASASAPLTVLPANFLGDDHFRDAPVASAASTSSGLDWADFGIGAGTMLGALVLLMGLSGIVVVSRRRSRTLGHT